MTLSFGISVSESKDLKGPVSTVIERELKTLLGSKDIKQFNSDFLEKNSRSLLHRLSGKNLEWSCSPYRDIRSTAPV